MFRRLSLGCVLLGACPLWAAAAQVDEPRRFSLPPAAPVAAADNQTFANLVALHLRQSGQLRQYLINVTVQDGVVTLQGHVADPAQHDAALRLVQGMPGVRRVVDLVAVRGGVAPAAVTQAPLNEPAPLPKGPAPTAQPLPGLQPIPGMPPAGVPVPGQPPEPTPIFQAPPGHAPHGMQAPPLPPNAWPTYAPYNNFSRVAYPTLYTPNTWPFIGPMYPFPKVPPGWRSIHLNYYDGHWWYGKHATGYDWWRIRYY
jgi:hypothetical protein